MKKQVLIITMGMLCAFGMNAQNDMDAMRYSQLSFGGTARFNSMGGSMGALGGDFSTLSFNPAGIGVFRKNELSISPSLYTGSTSSNYLGSNSSDFKLNGNFGNVGIVATFKIDQEAKGTKWESFNFGFGYNRKANFHNRISIEGDNKTSSLLDSYVAEANGYTAGELDPFSSRLAWDTWLIDDTSNNYTYHHAIPFYGEKQKKSTTTTGSVGETVISFGGNYNNKIFLGATIGIVKARYEEESVYEEIDDADTITYFKSFALNQNLTTKGNGLNLKTGIIVKPIDFLSIGAAIHTPTIFTLRDIYSSSMNSDLEDGYVFDTVSPQGSFDYRIITPFRAIGSVGFIINKMALLNIDYEYVDYSFAQLNSDPKNYFTEINKTIRSSYKPTGNLRIGGEMRFDPFSLRLGYAFYGSPYKMGLNSNANRNSFSGGIGIREDNYFIDFAYVFTSYKEYSYLYTGNSETVKNNFRSSSLIATFGLRF